VRLGLGQTRLASYEVGAPHLDQYPEWRAYCYPNHPFLSVLVTSMWFRVFGNGEAVLRFSLIVVSLGSLFAFLKLAERRFDARWAAVATALFAFTPMFWYFSITAVHLVYALAFSLAAWACWIRWEESPWCRAFTFIFLFLACQSDWPGYHAALSIAIDAFLRRRRAAAAGALGLGLGCFALHLLHLYGVDPAHGPLVKKLLNVGVARSAQGLPSPAAFASSELRELGVYFTPGLLALALVGFRRMDRSGWLLALFGLDEFLFMRWSHLHDYMTYGFSPFFAMAAAGGAKALWEHPRRRILAGALLGLAAAQSVWIMTNRLGREGAYEVNIEAGRAIREGTDERDRVLITVADQRFHSAYYAQRYTAGVEPNEPSLMIHPSGDRFPAPDVESLEQYFSDYTVVLVGDPDRAASEIRFFKGQRPPPQFRFLDASHPLRRKLEATAIRKTERGPFILYRLR